MFYIVYTPLQILGGIVADKFSPKLMIKIGLLGGAAANIVIFFNHNYYVMLVAWTLNAIIQFALWPSTYKIISSQLCRSDRTYMLFFISLASSIGLLLSYITATILPSWEYNFALSGGVLLLFAIGLHIYDRYLGRFMKPDYTSAGGAKSAVLKYNGSTLKMLWKSGFIILLLTATFRATVGQGVKTLSPLMLVESFDASTSTGNILNTLIIISGICGTLLVKLVLYPKIIKNEAVGIFIMFSIALVFAILLFFMPNMASTVATLCVMAVVTTAPTLFVSYFNTNFTKYGKNGTAAGISNAAASFGLVLSSYGMIALSDKFG
jgi:sugar phosphate permease